MSRQLQPKGKITRRFGMNIFESPKYDRLLERRPVRAVKGKRPGKISEFAKQLMEKQKLRLHYGMSEQQFRNLVERAKETPGTTGDTLLDLLERRLDNVIYLLGMAGTRAQARQVITHGHVQVNSKNVNIPSYIVSAGDSITVHQRSTSRELLSKLIAENKDRTPPEWLGLSKTEMKGTIIRLPSREEIATIANEQLVVEYYSR